MANPSAARETLRSRARRPDGYVARFLRLVALCPGLWICPAAADRFESQPDCQNVPALRRIFGWPNEAVLNGFLVADFGSTPSKLSAALKKQHGIVLGEKYPYKTQPDSKNRAYFFRIPGESVYNTPADQMAVPFDEVFPEDVLLQIRMGTGTTLAAPSPHTASTEAAQESPKIYRNVPMEVTVPILFPPPHGVDADAKPSANETELTDAENYACVSLLQRKRTHDSKDGVMTFGAKFRRGAFSGVCLGNTRNARRRADPPVRLRPRRSRAESRLARASRGFSSAMRRGVSRGDRRDLGGNVNMTVLELPQRGVGARALLRKVKVLAAASTALCPDDQERAKMLKKLVEADDAFDVAVEFGGNVRRLDLGESTFILDLVGSQQAYRKLASKLKHAFGRIVLEPIQNIMDEHELFEVWAEVVDHTVVDEHGVESTAKLVAWHSANVEKELQDELNGFGGAQKHATGRFVPRRFADSEVHDTITLLLGGDGGGGSFKDGIVVLNQDTPQSPLNVRWLGSVSGAKDTRDVLEKTALRPAFTKQVDALQQKKLVHVVTFSSKASEIEPSHGTVFVPKQLPMPSTNGYPSIVDLSAAEVKLQLAEDDVSGAWGELAVFKDMVVGVAVLQRLPSAERVSVDEFWIEALNVDSEKVRAFREHDDFAALSARISGFLGDADGLADVVVGVLPLLEPLPLGQLFVEVLGVRVILTGDWAFLSVVQGHMGAAATCLCPLCTTTKQDELAGILRAWRTHCGTCADARSCPLKGKIDRQRIMQTLSYKSNAHKSIEFPPLFQLDPRRNVSCAPLHFVLGEVWRAFKLVLLALGGIDETQRQVLEATTKCVELRAKADALDTEIKSLVAGETKLRADIEKKGKFLATKAKSLAEARKRIAAASGARAAAPKRTTDLVAKLTADVERHTADVVDLKKQLKALSKDISKEKRGAGVLKKQIADAELQLTATQGALVSKIYKLLKEHGIVIFAWFQKFVGNHAVKLLHHTSAIWSSLATVAATLDEPSRLLFEATRRDFEPLWTSLDAIVGIILSKEELSEDDIAKLEQNVDAYLADVKRLVPDGGDESVPLKRHGLKHNVQNAKDRHQVGLAAESVFESFHVEINSIKNRTRHVTNLLEREKAGRRQWSVRRSQAGRQARAEHKAAVARGPRKKSSD